MLLGEAASVAQLLLTSALVARIEYPMRGMGSFDLRLAVKVIPPAAMLAAGWLLRRARARGQVSRGVWAASFAAASLAMWGAWAWANEMDDLPMVWGGQSSFCCTLDGEPSLSSQVIRATPLLFVPALVGIATLAIVRTAWWKLLPNGSARGARPRT
jgi:hypothetical protein